MHVVSWETNKTRFSKYTSPQIGENQNCPTWVRSPLSTHLGTFWHFQLSTRLVTQALPIRQPSVQRVAETSTLFFKIEFTLCVQTGRFNVGAQMGISHLPLLLVIVGETRAGVTGQTLHGGVAGMTGQTGHCCWPVRTGKMPTYVSLPPHPD